MTVTDGCEGRIFIAINGEWGASRIVGENGLEAEADEEKERKERKKKEGKRNCRKGRGGKGRERGLGLGWGGGQVYVLNGSSILLKFIYEYHATLRAGI